MPLLSKTAVFFDEKAAMISDTWALEQIANSARRELAAKRGQYIFIKLDGFMDSQLYFSVMLARTPNRPLSIWKATVIDEDTEPEFELVFTKKEKTANILAGKIASVLHLHKSAEKK